MAIFLLILGLIMFIGLVVVHEWGHFVMARRNGVDVEEFGIGFPPRVYKKRIKSPKGDYDFTLNLLPLGGFVRLKGENDSAKGEGTFGAASVKAKSKIMAAGVVMNLITAFVLLTILAIIGMPKLIDNQFTIASDTKTVSNDIIIGATEKGSPAEKAGIKQSDHINGALTDAALQKQCQATSPYAGASVNECGNAAPDIVFNESKDLTNFTKSHAGQTVVLSIERDGTSQIKVVQLRKASEVEASLKTNKKKGYLGVFPTDYTVRRSTWSSPVVAGGLIGQFTKLTFEGLGKAVAGLGKILAGAVTFNKDARVAGQKQASEQVSGPVGIFVILRDGASLGFRFVLLIIAIISLTLAIMNILPIPALDGGRLWLTLATRAIKRPLSKEKEELINASGFVFLLLLIVLITIVDIRRFF